MSAREDIVRNELMQRRRRLEAAARESQDASELTRLLEQVDSALNRLQVGADGLTEARDQQDTEYGSQRLSAVLARNSSSTPAQLMNACLEDHRRFLNGLKKSDDMMIMIVQKRQ